MRGVEAELDGGLERGQSEVAEEVADLLLAGVDDLAGGGVVDGGGHILTKSLEVTAKLIQEGIGGDGRFRGHRLLLIRRADITPGLLSQAFPQRRRSRKICHTHDRADVSALGGSRGPGSTARGNHSGLPSHGPVAHDHHLGHP